MPDQTAMLLTQEEWEDLSAMVSHFRLCTRWVDDNPKRRKEASDYDRAHVKKLERQRALANRIIEANS